MPDALTHNADRDTSSPFIAAHAVNGASLESILADDPLLSLSAIQSIVTQVGAALGNAHAKDIVHGSLSTSCIMIDQNGDAIVARLGGSALRRRPVVGSIGDDLTALPYASPEVVRGERATPASDQYSLGVIAYELLAGRRPFEGSPSKVKRAHLSRRPEPIGALHLAHPDEWSRAVMKMIEKRPEERFASIGDAVRAFAPEASAQDDGFRGALGWLVQQKLPAAIRPAAVQPVASVPRAGRIPPPAPMPAFDPALASSVVDELFRATARPAHLFAGARILRKRRVFAPIMAIVAIAAVCVIGWRQLPLAMRMRLSGALPAVEETLTLQPAPTPMTSTSARSTAPAPTGPSRTSESREIRTRARPAATPVSDVSMPALALPPAPHIDSIILPPEREYQPPVPPPAVVAAAPVGPPPAAAAPLAASTTPVPRTLSPAEAEGAARLVADQIRRGDLRAVRGEMATSSVNADFIEWLRARGNDIQVGTPGPARIVTLPDGSAQVTYALPISWTHASGARRTRSASIATSVRASGTGVKVASWLLTEPFAP